MYKRTAGVLIIFVDPANISASQAVKYHIITIHELASLFWSLTQTHSLKT